MSFLRNSLIALLSIFLLLATMTGAQAEYVWVPFDDLQTQDIGAVRRASEEVNYQESLGILRDLSKAGNPEACYMLGNVNRWGHINLGIEKDLTEALRLYLLSAAQGYLPAMCSIGDIYGNGEGIEQDCVKAYMWYNLAAAGGKKDACKLRDLIAEKMTPEQIAEAQILSNEWRSKAKERSGQP